MLYPQGASATRYAAPVVPLPTVAVYVTIGPLPCRGTAASISSPTMQLHWLQVALVLLPVVSLPGESETSYTATTVLLTVAKLPVELLSNVLLVPPPAHSSNCTAKSNSATLCICLQSYSTCDLEVYS